MSVNMSSVDVTVKMSSGELNPLAFKISSENVEERDAKTEPQETHVKARKWPQVSINRDVKYYRAPKFLIRFVSRWNL